MTSASGGRSLAAALLLLVSSAGASAQGPAPSGNRFGIVDGSGVITSQIAMDRIRESGIGWANYVLFWNKVNPANGVYDWSGPDTEIGYMVTAGLNVFVRIMHPPAWTTGVSYPNDAVPFFCHDPTQPGNVRNHPDCNDPTKTPSAAAFDAFVRLAVDRYKGQVKAWGFGIEVHSRVFWQGTVEQFVQDILVPGYQAVKAVDPSVTVVGPDEDDPGSLAALLALEATHGQFADAISFHVLRHSLGATMPTAKLDAELKPVIDQHGAGRPVWLTELGMQATADCLTSGIQGEWLVDRLVEINARPWIGKTFIFSLKDAGVGEDFGILDPGDVPKPPWYAIRNFLAPHTSRSFLAEGATGPLFDMDVAIANPTCSEAPVRITFLKTDGTTVVQTPTVAPMSRATVRVNDVPGLANAAVSTVVESTSGVPLIVERSMFWDAGYYAGHGGSSVGETATRWYFGEGSQGFFDTYLLLANSTGAPATVTVTFLREAGGPLVRTFSVGPTSRFNVFAGDIAELVGTAFSMVVESDVPIIAERAMYFGTARFWDAGHESAGVPAPATSWFHAEGATGAFFDTFILIGNPNPAVANVTLTYLLSSGATVIRSHPIPPKSRLTVNVEAEAPILADAAVSTTVTADLPVISERAMYWPGGFSSWYEAHNSFGVTATAERWGLAEGRVGGAQGFETYILLANPSATFADVQITYLRTTGAPITKTYQIPATSRFNVHVNGRVPELSDESFGAVIEVLNGVAIVVERALYWNGGGQFWGGGTNGTASPLP